MAARGPAPGFRDAGVRTEGKGELWYVGLGGYSWASAVSSTNSVYLIFEMTDVKPSFAQYRAHGLQVRCLQAFTNDTPLSYTLNSTGYARPFSAIRTGTLPFARLEKAGIFAAGGGERLPPSRSIRGLHRCGKSIELQGIIKVRMKKTFGSHMKVLKIKKQCVSLRTDFV